jgi:hypothetical protein
MGAERNNSRRHSAHIETQNAHAVMAQGPNLEPLGAEGPTTEAESCLHAQEMVSGSARPSYTSGQTGLDRRH